MATSIELENVGRERYSVKDVKAKIQVDLTSKDVAETEVDDKDFYVCVNRDVKSQFIKADESSEDKIDQFIVKHSETITVVQGLASTKLTNPDDWIIKINRQLSETTFFKGKEIIDKISQRQENLERNKESPIVQAAIAKELLKRSKEEQKILNVNQEPLDEYQNSIENEKLNPKENQTSEENNHFVASTTASESSSPDTSKDKQEFDITVKADVETIKPSENLKITTVEREVENGAEIELLKREVVSNFGSEAKSNVRLPTTEIKNEKSSSSEYGPRYEELLKRKELTSDPKELRKIELALEQELSKINEERPSINAKEDSEAGTSATGKETLKIKDVEAKVVNGTTNQPEKISLKSEKSEAKSNVGSPTTEIRTEKSSSSKYGPRYEELLKQKELTLDPIELKKIEHALEQELSKINEERASIIAKEDPEAGAENSTTNRPEKTSLKSEKSEAKLNEELPTTEINNEKTGSIKYGPRYEELLKQKELTSDPNELGKIEHVLEREVSKINEERASIFSKEDPEAGTGNSTTNQSEKTSLKSENSESILNDELPTTEIKNEKTGSINYGPRYEELLKRKELTSDPFELRKIERAMNEERSGIYAKEDPEAGAEAAKQRVREVFHMDVAELIIERDA